MSAGVELGHVLLKVNGIDVKNTNREFHGHTYLVYDVGVVTDIISNHVYVDPAAKGHALS